MPLSVSVPTVGQANSTEAVKVTNTLTALSSWANGGIATTDIGASLAQSATVNQSGQTVKGAVNIAASESRTNVAYGTLTTPDQVAGVVLPANGLIVVWYQALWQESVSGAGRAAIFVGSNQAVIQQQIGGNAPAASAGRTGGGSANVNKPLFTTPIGLASVNSAGAYSADLTTGQIIGLGTLGDSINTDTNGTTLSLNGAAVGGTTGGPCYMFAAAGTYTVGVQFKSSSGSVTASNRKLWVQAISFA